MNRAVLPALLALGLAAPSTAAATPVCSFNLSTHVLSVSYTASGGEAELSVNGSGSILLNDAVCAQTAGVNTVDTIDVKDTSGKDVKLILDMDNGGFAPGPAAEAGSPEIEFNVDLGQGTDDQVVVDAPLTGSAYTVGQQGINLDPAQDKAGPPAGVDADMTLAGVEYVAFDGSNGKDVFDGRGGDGTGAPTDLGLYLYGGYGNDVFHGGAGDDDLIPGSGDDVVDGGPGTDVARYYGAAGPVVLDLRTTAPQATGDGLDTITGVEGLIGSDYDDVIHGNDGPNELQGYGGDDTIYALGGADVIYGEKGKDTIFSGAGHDDVRVNDGEQDTVDCGTGTDVLQTDPVDVLEGCTATAPDPTPTPTPTASPTATATATPVATTPGGDPTPPTTPGTDPTTPGTGPTTPGTGPTTPGTDPTTPGHDGAGTSGGNKPVLTITARRQKRRAVRKRGLRVRLTAIEDGSVALHAGKAKDVFWALEAGKPLTVKLRVSRRTLRTGRARVTAVLEDAHGTATTVTKTVRFR